MTNVMGHWVPPDPTVVVDLQGRDCDGGALPDQIDRTGVREAPGGPNGRSTPSGPLHGAVTDTYEASGPYTPRDAEAKGPNTKRCLTRRNKFIRYPGRGWVLFLGVGRFGFQVSWLGRRGRT